MICTHHSTSRDAKIEEGGSQQQQQQEEGTHEGTVNGSLNKAGMSPHNYQYYVTVQFFGGCTRASSFFTTNH